MYTVWTQHCTTTEDKQRFTDSLSNSRWVLDHLGTILKDLEKGLEREEASPKAYDKPNWEYRQAHANGFKQCLYQIQDLINLDQRKTND